MKNPAKYYYGMMGAMLLVTVSGFFPLAMMVSVDRNYADYYSGYWPEMGELVRLPIAILCCEGGKG